MKEENTMSSPENKKSSLQYKIEKYGWNKSSKMGIYMEIPKNDLALDLSYQREEVSIGKVRDLAANFMWAAFGTLIVVLRQSGEMLVADGGHRLRSTLLRDDIDVLPCIVNEVNSLAEEAKIFETINRFRTGVNPVQLHKAQVVQEKEIPMIAKDLVERYGLQISERSNAKNGFKAIRSLEQMIQKDKQLAYEVFDAAIKITGDKKISGKVLDGLFYAAKDQKNQGIELLTKGNIEKLVQYGAKVIETEYDRMRFILNKGGKAVMGKAVLELINKKRRTNRYRLANVD